jgi:amicyanin
MTRTLARARLPMLLLIGAAVLLVAPLGTRAATHEVTIADFAFAPQELTITAGDTVTWTNTDPLIHTATSTGGAFDSGDIDTGESFSLTFTTPGTYDYLCTPHPIMTGRIVVLAAAGPAATPAPSGGLPNVALDAGSDFAPTRLLGGVLLVAAALLVLARRRLSA